MGLKLPTMKRWCVGIFSVRSYLASLLKKWCIRPITAFLDSLPTLGFSDLFRIWNYFPEINGDRDGLERYQRFCMGRHQAFSEHYGDYKLALPAASAVGTLSGPFQLYFLAGRQKAIHIENPRQISAYDYPPMYGPKSPSFARATLTSISKSSYLFLAGTASIVGHATQHQEDPSSKRGKP